MSNGFKQKSPKRSKDIHAHNYPNPFNPKFGTTIRYILADTAREVAIKIYDIKGGLLKELIGPGNININDVFWDGKDSSGNFVNSDVLLGVIEASLSSGGKSKKIIKMAAWRTK